MYIGRVCSNIFDLLLLLLSSSSWGSHWYSRVVHQFCSNMVCWMGKSLMDVSICISYSLFSRNMILTMVDQLHA